MFTKFKEKILKKRFAVPLLAFFSLFIFYPAKASAAAFLVTWVLVPLITAGVGALAASLVKTLTAAGMIIAGLTFAAALWWAFLDFGIGILNWGIRGPFGAISMTNPANNQIINIGWTLLRDLTNMFFILGLAYIGLATALNFASFNTKKTFTTLILIALLINFTPVICGLIIDGTNIIMNFFLSEVNFNSIATSYKDTESHLQIPGEKDLGERISFVVFRYLSVGIYATLAGITLTIFGGLLLIRHFIVWLLVILSPLAFFCHIFDFSEQWYKKWWSTFISWAFIGIPAAFFLYLANHLLVLAKAGKILGGEEATQFWAALAPYFITIVFMIIGLITTLKIRTAGSGLIMNSANKIATKAKSLPGLVQSKIGTPMGKTFGAAAGALVGGGLSSKGRAAYTAAGGGKKGLQAMAQSGVEAGRERQQARAKKMEQLGIKPRELEDVGEEDLKKIASTPATTPEGLQRRAKAIKKLVDDDNFDASDTVKTAEMLGVMAQYPGMNLDKLKKAHPELEHLIDTKKYQEKRKEIATSLGINLEKATKEEKEEIDGKAQRVIITERTSKLSSADFAKLEIEKGLPTEEASTVETVPKTTIAMFVGLTPGKIENIKKEASPARMEVLERFARNNTPENKALKKVFIDKKTNIEDPTAVNSDLAGNPEWLNMQKVLDAINKNDSSSSSGKSSDDSYREKVNEDKKSPIVDQFGKKKNW